jgi:hypothetical protein
LSTREAASNHMSPSLQGFEDLPSVELDNSDEPKSKRHKPSNESVIDLSPQKNICEGKVGIFNR